MAAVACFHSCRRLQEQDAAIEGVVNGAKYEGKAYFSCVSEWPGHCRDRRLHGNHQWEVSISTPTRCRCIKSCSTTTIASTSAAHPRVASASRNGEDCRRHHQPCHGHSAERLAGEVESTKQKSTTSGTAGCARRPMSFRRRVKL